MDEIALKLDRQAFGFRIGVSGHVCEEGFAGCKVVLLCGKEGSERAVRANWWLLCQFRDGQQERGRRLGNGGFSWGAVICSA